MTHINLEAAEDEQHEIVLEVEDAFSKIQREKEEEAKGAKRLLHLLARAGPAPQPPPINVNVSPHISPSFYNYNTNAFSSGEVNSVEGSIRDMSEFCSSLLDPESELYMTMEHKFSNMITNTFKKSPLNESFLGAVIKDFSPGSLRVTFLLLFESVCLPPSISSADIVAKSKEIVIEEIMAPGGGELKRENIDMDNIVFSCPTARHQSHRRGPPAQMWLDDVENVPQAQHGVENTESGPSSQSMYICDECLSVRCYGRLQRSRASESISTLRKMTKINPEKCINTIYQNC